MGYVEQDVGYWYKARTGFCCSLTAFCSLHGRLMYRNSGFLLPLLLPLLVLQLGCFQNSDEPAAFPRKPIKVIVPFAAGGGTDSFTRVIQQAIQEKELLPQPLVVINVPGAGGSIGARRVKNARPDGYTILQLHDGMLTNKHSGNSNFGAEAFTGIAGTGEMAHVIAVREDSPFDNLQSLLSSAAEAPDSLLFAVGIGAPSHFAGMMLENAGEFPAGKKSRFRFTQSGGGSQRFASLLGGHSDVTTFSVSEFVEFKASGIRGLAILGNERHPQIPDLPTALEQGISVVGTSMHFWWAPKGTPAARIELISKALHEALATDQVQLRLEEQAITPVFLTGKDLEQELQQRNSQIEATSQRKLQKMPRFGLYILAATLLLGVIALRNHHSLEADSVSIQPTINKATLLLQLGIFVFTILYVLLLQWEIVDYRLATIGFMLATGGLLGLRGSRPWIPLMAVAMLLSFGLHFVFTRILVVDLP